MGHFHVVANVFKLSPGTIMRLFIIGHFNVVAQVFKLYLGIIMGLFILCRLE